MYEKAAAEEAETKGDSEESSDSKDEPVEGEVVDKESDSK